MTRKKIIIAIDGHSSCGKSTTAKKIAKELEYIFVDSGAMYRATTLFAIRNKILVNGMLNKDALIAKLNKIKISFKFNTENCTNQTFLNSELVESEIRQMEVSENVSLVSTIKEVRQAMVASQQQMGIKKGIVMDGRDIGTVVFPNAELKIFMTASPEIRAKRRFDELILKGEKVTLSDVLKNVIERDYIDSTRKESPLLQAKDAILLDNSSMTIEEQTQWIINEVRKIIDFK